jgi:hypothetical protein
MRAEEIAQDRYGKDFYDLPSALQDEVFSEGMDTVADRLADRADYLRKAEREG